jgi:hypothetical protein
MIAQNGVQIFAPLGDRAAHLACRDATVECFPGGARRRLVGDEVGEVVDAYVANARDRIDSSYVRPPDERLRHVTPGIASPPVVKCLLWHSMQGA